MIDRMQPTPLAAPDFSALPDERRGEWETLSGEKKELWRLYLKVVPDGPQGGGVYEVDRRNNPGRKLSDDEARTLFPDWRALKDRFGPPPGFPEGGVVLAPLSAASPANAGPANVPTSPAAPATPVIPAAPTVSAAPPNRPAPAAARAARTPVPAAAPQMTDQGSFESDLQEMFGSEGATIQLGLREAFAVYGERIGMAAIQGGLRREGVTNMQEVQHARNLVSALVQKARPSDVSKKLVTKLIRRDADIYTLLKDLPATLARWREEEDDAFIDEIIVMGAKGGLVRRIFGGGSSEREMKNVLKYILSQEVRSKEQVETVLASRIGKRFARSVAANIYQYATGHSEGDRKFEMLERAQYFGLGNAEVEALVRSRR